MKFRFQRKYFSIPYIIFLSLFVIVPILLIVYYAFSDATGALSVAAAAKFFSDTTKLQVILVSFFISVQTTLICLLIGYPLAYFLANTKINKNVMLIMLFIMPMWINFVLRTTATRSILFAVNLTGGNTPYLATLIGMVYNYLPFVILPLYTTMLKLDHSQVEAAADLGASPIQVFIKNIIPQSIPGIISAVTMTLVPVMSSYVISDALSEGNVTLIGNSIYLNFANYQWNSGSFMAFVLLILVVFSMFMTRGQNKAETRGGLW
ncbi:MAG: ABC transporter permease [Bacilli bacterium]|nr:ABC transporter permease [Bacilli bacterium]